MNQEQIEQYILSLAGAELEHPFEKDVAVYKVDDKMFALIKENSRPLKISLKCDPLLAVKLRERYETVMPGEHLNKKHWNTILATGQLEEQEIKDLIRHSYELAKSQATSE